MMVVGYGRSLRKGRSVIGVPSAATFATTLTGKVCVVVELSFVSVAVTVMRDDSPALAFVASMWITPLGLVVVSVAELMRIGLTGLVIEVGLRGSAWSATLVICWMMPWGSSTT